MCAALAVSASPVFSHRRGLICRGSWTIPCTRHTVRPDVLRRYKDDDVEDLQLRRSKEEAVIREQEKRIQEEGVHANEGADREKPAPATPPAEVKPFVQPAAAKPRMDPQAPRVSLLTPAFTRRREIFVGRIAMTGFFMACLWEWLLAGHPNITQQVAIPFDLAGIPVSQSLIATGLSAVIVFDLLAALLPWSPTWSKENQRDVMKRPPGPPNSFVNPFTEWRSLLGISGWGFTKANELFHGRLGMIGFTAALLNQMQRGGYYGPGPLAQVAGLLGVVPDDTFYSYVAPMFISFVVLATVLAYRSGKPGSTQGDDDIY